MKCETIKRRLTDEIEDDSAVGAAAGGAVEEGLAVGEGGDGVGLAMEGEEVVSGVGEGVAEADDGGEATESSGCEIGGE